MAARGSLVFQFFPYQSLHKRLNKMAKHIIKNGLQTTMKPGKAPPPGKQLPKIGSGRNRPAKGFNQITKEWKRK